MAVFRTRPALPAALRPGVDGCHRLMGIRPQRVSGAAPEPEASAGPGEAPARPDQA